MSRYESRADLRSKIDWEGGLESFLEYGFYEDDVPEGDEELRAVAEPMLQAWTAFQEAANAFLDLLPEAEGAW